MADTAQVTNKQAGETSERRRFAQLVCLFTVSKFEEAMEVLTQGNGRDVHKYTVESIGIAYLDHLLHRGLYDTAGKLCLKIFGANKALWEEEIFKFATVHQLRFERNYTIYSCTSESNTCVAENIK